MQMGGFLVGGVVGVVGDKIGRIELLSGSILLYSIGTPGTASSGKGRVSTA
jgi:hypothetical protein